MSDVAAAEDPMWIREPTDELRARIADQAQDLGNAGSDRRIDHDTEEAVEHLLSEIGYEAQSALTWDAPAYADDDPDRVGEQLFGSVSAWASLASYVLAAAYAPQSPLPPGLAGWGAKVQTQLQRVVQLLLAPLRTAAAFLGASTWSISVSFPWAGVQVGLGWP